MRLNIVFIIFLLYFQPLFSVKLIHYNTGKFVTSEISEGKVPANAISIKHGGEKIFISGLPAEIVDKILRYGTKSLFNQFIWKPSQEVEFINPETGLPFKDIFWICTGATRIITIHKSHYDDSLFTNIILWNKNREFICELEHENVNVSNWLLNLPIIGISNTKIFLVADYCTILSWDINGNFLRTINNTTDMSWEYEGWSYYDAPYKSVNFVSNDKIVIYWYNTITTLHEIGLIDLDTGEITLLSLQEGVHNKSMVFERIFEATTLKNEILVNYTYFNKERSKKRRILNRAISVWDENGKLMRHISQNSLTDKSILPKPQANLLLIENGHEWGDWSSTVSIKNPRRSVNRMLTLGKPVSVPFEIINKWTQVSDKAFLTHITSLDISGVDPSLIRAFHNKIWAFPKSDGLLNVEKDRWNTKLYTPENFYFLQAAMCGMLNKDKLILTSYGDAEKLQELFDSLSPQMQEDLIRNFNVPEYFRDNISWWTTLSTYLNNLSNLRHLSLK